MVGPVDVDAALARSVCVTVCTDTRTSQAASASPVCAPPSP